MRREDRLLRRLWRETRDWCRQAETSSEPPLTRHRNGVQAHPGVWGHE